MPRSVPEWIGATPDTPIPRRVKIRVFEREGGICYLSGRKIRPGDLWECDHRIALINRGENRESNLVPAIHNEHKRKTKDDLAKKSEFARKRGKAIGLRKKLGFRAWRRFDGSIVRKQD